MNISPHLASPEGEGQILLLPDYQSVIDIQGNQLLPYGGEREGADVHWLRKRECHKHSQIHENPDRNPITIYQLLLPYKIRMQGGQLLHNIVQIHVAVWLWSQDYNLRKWTIVFVYLLIAFVLCLWIVFMKEDNTSSGPLSYHYYSNAYKSNMTLKVVSSCSNIEFQDVT